MTKSQLILDSVNCEYGCISEGFQDFQNRFACKRLSLVEQYLKNVLWVAVQYAPTHPGVDEFSALALVCHEGDAVNTSACFRSGAIGEVQRVDVHGGTCGDQNNMFVGDVQIVKPFQPKLPATVRLYFVNDSVDDFVAWGKSFSFMSIDGTYKRLPVPVEGKPSEVTPDRLVSVGSDVVSVIKGDTKIVDSVAQNGRDMLVERFGFNVPSLFQRSVLALGSQSLHVVTDVAPKSGFKITDVMFGPFNF